MPFKSKSQRRFMYAAEARGELPKGTAKEWEKHAPKGSELPEKVKKTEQLKKDMPASPSLPSMPSMPGTMKVSKVGGLKQVKDPTKVGKQTVTAKIPKLKKPASAFAPPSVFFGKSEDFEGPKHPSLRNLWDFLNKKHKK